MRRWTMGLPVWILGMVATALLVAGAAAVAAGSRPSASRPAVATTPARTPATLPMASSSRERSASARAYRGLSSSAAVRVARSRHAELLGSRPAAPISLATSRRVRHYLSDHVARIRSAGGQRTLLESSLPLRVPGANHRKRPVDLRLRRSKRGYRLAAPIVPIEISRTVAARISFPEIGLRASASGAGRGTAPVVRDGRVFYPNAMRDTDVVVAPAATGAETFSLLRSKDSPENLALELSTARGAELQPDPKLGGYAVVRGGRPIAHVATPVAWDADRRPVPVSTSIDGDVLRMHVPHRGAGASYPIVVDPAVVEDFRDWRGTVSTDFRGWNYDTDTSGKFTPFYGNSYLGNGLYMYNRTAQDYNDGDTRRWFFNVLGFGDAYIYRADYTNLYHEYNGTCLTEGIYSRSAGAYEPGSPASQCAALTTYPSKVMCVKVDCTPGGTRGNSAMFGIRAQGAGQRSTFTGYLGGAAIYETDDVKPVMANGAFPTGWVSSGTGLTVRGTDTGLGMEKVVLDSPAKADWDGAQTKDFACAGDRNHRCPKIIEITFDTGNLPDGTVPIRATGTDVLGDTTTQTWYVKIDHAAPVITANTGTLWDHRDQAADHRDEGLYGADYGLHLEAGDGADSSGVKSIDIQVVNKATGAVERTDPDPLPQPCPAGGCSKPRDWSFHSDDYSDGQHLVQAVLTDQGGRQTTRDVLTATVDRRGDIYHGTSNLGDPAAGAEQNSSEWGKIGTRTGRFEDSDTISTRHTITCDGGGPCDETKLRTRMSDQDATARDDYEVTRGSSVDDPNVPFVANILEPAKSSGTVVGTGNLHDLAQPWQALPPAHGTTYELRDDQFRNDNGDLVDGKIWLDTGTKMPIKSEIAVPGAAVETLYWTYSTDRLEQTQVAADFFDVPRPAAVSKETNERTMKEQRVHSASDPSTGQSFNPYFAGLSPSITGVGAFCLSSTDILDFTSAAPGADTAISEPDPELPPAKSVTRETFTDANYTQTGASGCVPGKDVADSPALEVITYAHDSASATEWRGAYMEAGQATELDVTDADYLRAGIRPVTFNQQATTAYVLVNDDSTASALVDVGGTTLIINGPFDKNTVAAVVAEVTPE